MKYYHKGTSEKINDGYVVTIFNNFLDKPFNEYDVNYQFYIKECYKEIELLENKQLQLL